MISKKAVISAPIMSGDSGLVQVSIADLPRPDRLMTCNVVGAFARGPTLELVFGQAAPGASELTSALIVHIPERALAGALDVGGSSDFRQSLSEYIEREGWAQPDVPDPTKFPERTVIERASTLAISFANEEADIRFYRVLPFEFRQMQVRQKFTAEFLHPVVEVALSTDLLGVFMRRLEEVRRKAGRGNT